MRIALVSVPYGRTPPIGYGGIERVVYTLAEQLVKMGHRITLFATPGSYCSGKTIEVGGYDPSKAPSGVHKKSGFLTEEPLYEAMRNHLKQHPVDVIHDWSFQNLFVLRHPKQYPFLISTCVPPAEGYKRPNLVACSKAHAGLYNQKTRHVHYGLDLNQWAWQDRKKDHFIHISKIARYKAQHVAVRAARRTGSLLDIAGNIEGTLYYYLFLKPLIGISRGVRYIGEIRGTNYHMKEAKALIQTPKWFDAFPLVVLEAFASGTPVIGLKAGGIAEQIIEGVNGFLCKGVDDMCRAMMRIDDLSPAACRHYAEKHFSADRMARDYIHLYEEAIDGKFW